MSSLVLSLLFGYLIGSFPTAFIIVKWKKNIDIRRAGSGNVGAFNSFDVTKSKGVGASVLVIDLLKGIAATIGGGVLFGQEFAMQASAGIGATLGHTYPVWLRFEGGRGLATAAGVMLVLAGWFVAVWALLWFAGFKMFKDINMGNAVATLFLIIAVLVTPESLLLSMVPAGTPTHEFRLFGFILLLIILTKLISPVREYRASQSFRNNP